MPRDYLLFALEYASDAAVDERWAENLNDREDLDNSEPRLSTEMADTY